MHRRILFITLAFLLVSFFFFSAPAPLALAASPSDGIGSHTAMAVYNGDANHATSTSNITMPVLPGATIIVTSNFDSGAGSLRQAINSASPGDTIMFNGNYTITLVSELTIDKSLTIDGTGHSVTVSGNNATRVFNITTGTVTLNQLTVANGNVSSGNGGGIYNASGAILSVTNSTLSGSSGTSYGGGIYNASGAALNVAGSTLSGNSASYAGGGISNMGTLTVTNSTFSNNSGAYSGGGGIENEATATVTDSTFVSNHAPGSFGYGGGIENLGTLTVTSSTFSGNSPAYGGAGIYSQNQLTVTNSTFYNNSASSGGSGLMNNTGTATLTNSTFSGNSAGYYGGGINNVGTLTVTNNTFSGNSAQSGGGLYNNYDKTATVTNSIIANNSSGGNCYTYSPIGVSNNLADDGSCGTGFTESSSILLGTLGSYGGSTQTVPLLPGSAAIDGVSANCPTTDQRGMPRGATCDIGAFESGGFTLAISGGNNQTTIINTAFTNPLSVAVTANNASEPVDGGKVTFSAPGSGASATLTGSPATIASGTAGVTATANGTAGGPYSVTASSAGATSVTFGLTNIKIGTTTILISAPDSSIFGDSVTLTATVTSGVGMPTGNVTFQADGTTITGCDVQSLNGSGQATCTTSGLTVGSHALTAVYNGDLNDATSTSNTVTQAVCGTALAVSNNADSGAGSLRQAITDVCTGGTITFNGNYTITLASELAISKNLTIDGTGRSVTVSGNNVTRVFNITTGTVSLNQFRIAHGKASSGGGIYNYGTLNVTDISLSSSSADYGGGIYNSYGTLNVSNSTFSGNFAYYDGGGIDNEGGWVTVTNSAFSGNRAYSDHGGGIYNNYGTLNVTGSTFSDNIAKFRGGGIYSADMLTVTNSTFSGNSGGWDGGGVANYFATATVTNSTFTGNGADYGGGISNYGGTLNLANSTFSGNSSTPAHGGGINNWGTTKVTNIIVANTTAGGNCNGDSFTSDSVNNLADDASCVTGFSTSSSILLGTLGNYGGPTHTLPLLPGSTAIDATSTDCPATDQRGITRPQGNACDIGAFESGGFALAIGGGNNQSAVANTPFINPLVVTVTPNKAGEPVNGGKVTFTAPGSGASATLTGSPATIASGAASVTATANTTLGGPYQVTASTAGATSVLFNLTNSSASTTTTLTSQPNPSSYGEPVTLTAVVTSGSGTPTGSLTFYDGEMTISGCEAQSLTSGQATCTVSGLSVGSHAVTAIYSGDMSYASSMSNLVTQQVNAASTTTTLVSSLNPSTFGDAVTLTAMVTSGVGTPTGAVRFMDGLTVISGCQEQALDEGSQATCVTSFDGGSHALVAGYYGDSSHAPSTSSTVTQVVNPASTTTTLVSSPNPALYGQALTFTATVASTAGTPGGAVQFYNNGAVLGGPVTLSSGSAVLTTADLSAGTHGITATHSSDPNYVPSTSPVLVQGIYPRPAIAAGYDHTCYLKSGGTLACWGDNSQGQLNNIPTDALLQVSTIGYHACGLRGDGTLACWGDNSQGQLNNIPLGVFAQVSAGGSHNCALSNDGTLACWGNSTYGQLSGIPDAPLTQVSAGGYHSCALRSDGSLACWGNNELGQLDNIPTGVFTQVSAGVYHTCAIKSDGTLACWGYNGYGQAPADPLPGDTFSQVSAGRFHTCGLKRDGTLACWGTDEYGQATPPTGAFTQVSAGTDHTCALKSDGARVCWGRNNLGQTHNITFTPLMSPKAMVGTGYNLTLAQTQYAASASTTLPKATVGAGYDLTLVPGGATAPYILSVDPAIIAPGLTFDPAAGRISGTPTTEGTFPFTIHATDSFELSFSGQADYVLVVLPATLATLTSSPNPSIAGQPVTLTATVNSTTGTPTGWVQLYDNGVALGGPLTLSNSIAVTSTTELALGTHSLTITYGGDGTHSTTTSAVLLHGVNPRPALDAGGLHTCAVLGDGTLACWGDDRYGQAPAKPFPTDTFTQVRSGWGHSCAVTSNGTLACWGYNNVGQLDNIPTGIFAQASAGQYHTCALRSDGTLACWGYNETGQAPLNPFPLDTFTQVSAGGFHTCAIKSDGSIICWGLDGSGQTTPPAGIFTQVSAGGYHTCALKSDGTVICWGDNSDGQLDEPGGTFTQVSAGEYHTCGIKSDGTLACWGNNDYDQATAPAGTFTQVTAGGYHTCALRSDGAPVCWGNNELGATHKITVNPSVLAEGIVGVEYDQLISAGGGVAPYTLAVVDGAVPPGLTFDPAAGRLSGTPTTNGTFTLTVQATDSFPLPFSGQHTYTVSVKHPTTTTVTSAPNPSAFGQVVTLTATVTSTTGTPTGTVMFKDDGTTIDGCDAQSLTDGQANCTASGFSVGSHTITAHYGGDENYRASNNSSAPLTQNVRSINATLSNLVLSSGVLTPAFSPGVTSYTADIAGSVTSLTVTPRAVDANATIKVNGAPVISGTSSGAIPLNVGPNTINVAVTAEDGVTIKTYTVTVTRAEPDTPTPTATSTATHTPTNTPTATSTPTNTPTSTPTDTPTFTPTSTPTNTLTSTSTPTNTPTFTPSNTPTITLTPTPVVNGDLSIRKTAQVQTSGRLFYWLTIKNAGPSTVRNIVVTDTLPMAVQFISLPPQTTSGWQCTYAAVKRMVTCKLASLARGSSQRTWVFVRVVNRSRSFTNCATVRAGTFDPKLTNNRACLTLSPNLAPVAPSPETPAANSQDVGHWFQSLWKMLVGWLEPPHPIARR